MGALVRILDPRGADGVDGCEPSASVDGMATLERVVRTVAGVAAAMRGPLAGVAGAMAVRQCGTRNALDTGCLLGIGGTETR
jgi:hypothetical protein